VTELASPCTRTWTFPSAAVNLTALLTRLPIACLGLGSGVLQHLERALDRRERSPQLVRERGEEAVLGALFAAQLCAGRGKIVVGGAQHLVDGL